MVFSSSRRHERENGGRRRTGLFRNIEQRDSSQHVETTSLPPSTRSRLGIIRVPELCRKWVGTSATVAWRRSAESCAGRPGAAAAPPSPCWSGPMPRRKPRTSRIRTARRRPCRVRPPSCVCWRPPVDGFASIRRTKRRISTCCPMRTEGGSSHRARRHRRGAPGSRLSRLVDAPPRLDDAERFAAHLATEFSAVFLFLWAPSLDATNWRAEQAIRPAVVVRKVCGGNRHGASRRPADHPDQHRTGAYHTVEFGSAAPSRRAPAQGAGTRLEGARALSGRLVRAGSHESRTAQAGMADAPSAPEVPISVFDIAIAGSLLFHRDEEMVEVVQPPRSGRRSSDWCRLGVVQLGVQLGVVAGHGLPRRCRAQLGLDSRVSRRIGAGGVAKLDRAAAVDASPTESPK